MSDKNNKAPKEKKNIPVITILSSDEEEGDTATGLPLIRTGSQTEDAASIHSPGRCRSDLETNSQANTEVLVFDDEVVVTSEETTNQHKQQNAEGNNDEAEGKGGHNRPSSLPSVSVPKANQTARKRTGGIKTKRLDGRGLPKTSNSSLRMGLSRKVRNRLSTATSPTSTKSTKPASTSADSKTENVSSSKAVVAHSPEETPAMSSQRVEQLRKIVRLRMAEFLRERNSGRSHVTTSIMQPTTHSSSLPPPPPPPEEPVAGPSKRMVSSALESFERNALQQRRALSERLHLLCNEQPKGLSSLDIPHSNQDENGEPKSKRCKQEQNGGQGEKSANRKPKTNASQSNSRSVLSSKRSALTSSPPVAAATPSSSRRPFFSRLSVMEAHDASFDILSRQRFGRILAEAFEEVRPNQGASKIKIVMSSNRNPTGNGRVLRDRNKLPVPVYNDEGVSAANLFPNEDLELRNIFSEKSWAQLFRFRFIESNEYNPGVLKVIQTALKKYKYPLHTCQPLQQSQHGNNETDFDDAAPPPHCVNGHCMNELMHVMCDESCGPLCENRRFVGDWQSNEFYGASDETHLICMKANVPLPANQYIMEVVGIFCIGPVSPNQEFAHDATLPGMKTPIYINTSEASNFSGFLSHSTTPNCKVERWIVDGEIKLVVKTLEEISSGAIITVRFPQIGDDYLKQGRGERYENPRIKQILAEAGLCSSGARVMAKPKRNNNWNRNN